MSVDFPVVFALYPNVTQLDFTGPYEVLARVPGAQCVLASVAGGTIEAPGGITFAGIRKLQDVDSCALLCVPGGYGTVQALEDRQYLAQLRRLAGSARYVTSVCTGSLLLAAAGLLTGKRAACHWAWRDSLAAFGSSPIPPGSSARATSSPAAASLPASIWRSRYWRRSPARTMRRPSSWSSSTPPMPPFDSGRPESARPGDRRRGEEAVDAVSAERDAAVRRAAAALTV